MEPSSSRALSRHIPDRPSPRSFALLLVLLAPAINLCAATPVFDYDQQRPLDIRESDVRTIDGAEVHDLTYASPKGGRVPAYLVVPPSKTNCAGLVFLHWGFGDRGTFLPEAILYAKSGAESLLVDGTFLTDGSYTRDENAAIGLPNPEGVRRADIQMLVDLRRAVDLLSARPEINRARIGFIGHSLGANFGGVLAGVDKRVHAYVLMGGEPQASAQFSQFDKPGIALLRTLDADQYVGSAAPAAILFQFARHDEFITKDMADLWIRTASNPKEIKWYETDHAFNIAAFTDRADFLRRHLGIRPVDPASIGGRHTLLPDSDLKRYAAYQRLFAASHQAGSQ